MDYVRTVQFHHEMPWIVRYNGHRLSSSAYIFEFSYRLLMTKPFGYGTAHPVLP